ncbi:MAG TPA: ABC transporter ATP-binding protein [Thermoleophilia bacterium]|nr:ABC transporter ATP-binding protein [Thermoleophilia bacterium]
MDDSLANGIVMTVTDLRIELDPSGTEIDDGVCFELRQGEVLGLVGESASGKTTAATSLLAFQRRGARIAGGDIDIAGKDVLKVGGSGLRQLRGGTISYVPQDPGSALNPALRIGLQLTEILEAHSFGASDQARQERVKEMMAEVLLPSDREFLRRYPHQLSGGQQQRVALGMAFACRPKVIVLDEPTTGLDVTTQAHVLDTIRDLTRAHHVAAVYVTHDLAVVANLADRIAVMYAGRIVEIGRKERLFGGASHPYTRRLLAAIPTIGGSRTLRGIPGFAPRPGGRPPGCPFAPRCDYAVDRCRVEMPPETLVGVGHRVRCWRAEEVGALPVAAEQRGEDQIRDAIGVEEIIAVRGVTAWYGSREVLHDVTITVRPRQCLALVGESGSGKTTLARCIAGLHPFKIEGDILFQGKPLPRGARQRAISIRHAIQYVFQNPYSSLNPRKTIGQILTQPLSIFFDLSRDEREDRLSHLLGLVALDDSLLARYPDQLSGGERQRVAIARALAAEPTVLVCDEVTSWLDVSVQAAIVELLVKLQNEIGLSMLFVTHNLALIRSISHEVAVMSEGRIVEYGEVDAVLADPQADYTKKLLSDTPTIEPVPA